MSGLAYGPKHPADCGDGTLCLGETACHRIQNGSYDCRCWHDGQPPRNGWECNRRTVTGSPPSFNMSHLGETHKSPGPIQVQILPPGGLSKPNDGLNVWSHEIAIPLVLLAVTLLSVLTVGFCFVKRKSLKRFIQLHYSGEKADEKSYQLNQLNQSGPALGTTLVPIDRFVMNPTYESTCLLDLSIPVFLQTDISEMTQIGQGCFGKVFKGELNGEMVAIKVVKKEHSDEAVKEVETMAAFNHHNILRMIGVAKNSEMDAPWLIFEYMEYGDLASVLRTIPSTRIGFDTRPVHLSTKENPILHLTHESLLEISYQLAEGMKYLSSQHFVHRDLAARNCLVGKNGIVKISDFGLSRDVYTCDYYKIGGSRLLPVRWMSPESVLYGRFTLESDIWAYGILLWEIYSLGRQPYYGHSNEEVVQLILDGVLLCPPSDCPSIICEMMVGCWKSNPKDRLRFPVICEKFLMAFRENQMDTTHDYLIPNPKLPVEYMELEAV